MMSISSKAATDAAALYYSEMNKVYIIYVLRYVCICICDLMFLSVQIGANTENYLQNLKILSDTCSKKAIGSFEKNKSNLPVFNKGCEDKLLKDIEEKYQSFIKDCNIRQVNVLVA